MANLSKFSEVEFKYNAENISRESFDSLAESFFPERHLSVGLKCINGKDPVDYYFTAPSGDRFMRWRFGCDDEGTPTWELTSKLKTSDKNNNVRSEVNIEINSRYMSIDAATEFSRHHGCEFDFAVKKDVQVYWMGDVVLSHYTTYDLDGTKLNTFMEIEADERLTWNSEEEAVSVISDWEKRLAPLGITSRNRIKKSLFEFYTNTSKKEAKEWTI